MTVKLHTAWLPAPSSNVYVTLCVPMAKVTGDPLPNPPTLLVTVTEGLAPELSLAVGAVQLTAGALPVASKPTVMLSGQPETTGFPVSAHEIRTFSHRRSLKQHANDILPTTFRVKLQEAVLDEGSVAVTITECAPTLKELPEAGENVVVTAAVPALSVTDTPTRERSTGTEDAEPLLTDTSADGQVTEGA